VCSGGTSGDSTTVKEAVSGNCDLTYLSRFLITPPPPDIPCDEGGSLLLGRVHYFSLNVSVLVKCLLEMSSSSITAVKLTKRIVVDVFQSVVRMSLHMRSSHFCLEPCYTVLCFIWVMAPCGLVG
jgi:hypothetical protein